MVEPQNQSETETPHAPNQACENAVIISIEEDELVGDDERSVFPHYLVFVPVAIGLTWASYRLFRYHQRDIISYEPIGDGDSGRFLIDVSFLYSPILLLALLFFAYWGCRFALEGGASRREMLRRGFFLMLGIFVIGIFVKWLFIEKLLIIW